MKTLFVFPAYEPAWAFGGTVSSNVSLCKALARTGIEVVVYTTNADGKGGRLKVALNEPISLDGVEVWYFNCDLFVQRAFYSRGLNKKLKKSVYNFDVVHVAAIWQLIQFGVYKTCKLYSKPLVISPHGSISAWDFSNYNKNIKKKLFWNIFGQKTFAGSSGVHFTSQEERFRSFSNKPFLKDIPSFIVPNGIDIKKTEQSKNMRAKLNIPENQFVLLFVGRINRIKGLPFILEALKKLNNKRYLFLIVGNKEDNDYFEYLKKSFAEIQDSIIWYGSVGRNAIWDFYYAADLFVLPSYHENFSMVTVEAMSCGLPVMITRNVGIWREIQSDGAGVIVNQDADEIAEAIKKLANDIELLNRMKQNARKSAEARYDINKAGAMMLKAYEDILTGQRSPECNWKD